jgi:hypothetical protein
VSTPLHRVSAKTGVEIEGAEADLKVTVPEPGTVACELAVNGRTVRLRFPADGDVDVDVQPAS